MHKSESGLWSFWWEVLSSCMLFMLLIDADGLLLALFLATPESKTWFLCVWINPYVLLLYAEVWTEFIQVLDSTCLSSSCRQQLTSSQQGGLVNYGGKLQQDGPEGMGREGTGLILQFQWPKQWNDADNWDTEGQWLNFVNFSVVRRGGARKENRRPVHQK